MARILLAEDDDSLRTFLARALARVGHEVHAVPDGTEAMAALAGRPFDLVLADIVMPGVDGIELARRAAASHPELRIVLITGFAAMALRARQETLGRTRVLSKPMHLRELVSQIDELIAA